MRLFGMNAIDLACAVFLTSVGLFVVWEASHYPMGSPSQIGPGAFPVALGLLLVVTGVFVFAAATRSVVALPSGLLLRPLAALFAGLMSFALLLERAGLVPATVALVMLSAFAIPKPKLISAAATAIVLSGGGVLVFQHLLGIPMHAFVW